MRLVGVSSSGVEFKDIDVNKIGTIEGFTIDDENPALIVDGTEISMDSLEKILTKESVQGSSENSSGSSSYGYEDMAGDLEDIATKLRGLVK